MATIPRLDFYAALTFRSSARKTEILMPRLTRQGILDTNDLPTEEVEVKEWGGTVLIRPLTGAERGQLEGESVKMRSGDTTILPTLRARVAVWCCVNDDGTRMFTAKDVEALSAKHPEPLDTIFNTVKRLSGMDDKAEAKAAKNSKSSQSSDSGTSSS